LRSLHTVFHSGYNNLLIITFFPTSSSAFVVVCVLDDSYSHSSEMESSHGFDLHFLIDTAVEKVSEIFTLSF
jgi:hypothetical protein